MTESLESSGAMLPPNTLSKLRHTERSEVSLTERTDRDSSGKYVKFYSPFFYLSLRMTHIKTSVPI